MQHNVELPNSGFVSGRRVKARYDIGNSTLYQWISDGRLPRPIKIGSRAVRFRVEDLRAFEAKFSPHDDKKE